MKRRSFIETSAAASLTVASKPVLRWLPSFTAERPLRKKSLKWGMIKEDLSVMDKFKLIADLGFHGIELDSPDNLDDKEVLHAIDKTGIVVPGLVNSLHWKNPLSDPDPAVRSICTDSIIKALHRCKKLGGSSVLVVPGVVKKEVSYEEAWDRSTLEFEKIIPVAEEIGIDIAIENVWNNFLISPIEASNYIDQFDSDRIGWYFDVGNIVRYGWPEHWMEKLRHRIMKIDIKDYSRTKQQEEGIWEGFKVKLGDGDADWKAVNSALTNVGYTAGWGSAEVSGGDRVRLQEISERMDRLYAM